MYPQRRHKMYFEDSKVAAPYRRQIVDETNAYVRALRARGDENRKKSFAPDMTSPEAYNASLPQHRERLVKLMGRPLTEYPDTVPTEVKRELLDTDEWGTTERLWVEVLPGLHSYGLLFIPKGEGKFPYLSCFHGGSGTCEIISGVYNSANYNELVNRARKKANAITYVPQIQLWNDSYNTCDEEKSDNMGNDIRLKQVGASLAALEVFKIMRTVDWIVANLPVDTDRMGVLGLSYGGFYTQMNAAIDTRYKAALSSGYFNDRYKHGWIDWTWFDSAFNFLDEDIVRLICPRYLCIEVGEIDPLFKAEDARRVVVPVTETYAALGIADKFRFSPHPGNHEFNKTDENLDWFVEKLLS